MSTGTLCGASAHCAPHPHTVRRTLEIQLISENAKNWFYAKNEEIGQYLTKTKIPAYYRIMAISPKNKSRIGKYPPHHSWQGPIPISSHSWLRHSCLEIGIGPCHSWFGGYFAILDLFFLEIPPISSVLDTNLVLLARLLCEGTSLWTIWAAWSFVSYVSRMKNLLNHIRIKIYVLDNLDCCIFRWSTALGRKLCTYFSYCVRNMVL